MDIMKQMEDRHSVRKYQDLPISKPVLERLQEEIAACNKESGLDIQLVLDEPKAFDPKYGHFEGVENYIALIGRKGEDLDEKCGYYGEKIVLFAQSLGLNTCWVGVTYKQIEGTLQIGKDERLVAMITIGYGVNHGQPHELKEVSKFSNENPNSPEWFKRGLQGVRLAPSAYNEQKWHFFYDEENGEGKVDARPGVGEFAKVDLGIAKYQFEQASGKDSSIWIK
ncbi:nitroreductase family protein [Dubosiella muris]|uniref:Nitroreductase n=2 Tax=Dubosiella TaxID=1937008 RepID=A0AC61RA72_9FIRM|nr:nitroreductase family protein [Dubosiella muris]TGY67302.1 nitroreductase [Dubosiella muris]